MDFKEEAKNIVHNNKKITSTEAKVKIESYELGVIIEVGYSNNKADNKEVALLLFNQAIDKLID